RNYESIGYSYRP
ncbi:membrane dipeptidase family protein, partial [Chlamydia psittaci C1/97]